MATEIRRSLEYFSSHEPDIHIEHLVIYGGTSRLPSLADFLHMEVGLDVLQATPLELIDISNSRTPAEYLQELAPVLPVCIGLGLRDMLA
jgi:Tfp pilus assembly PilM family ATPase